MKFDLTRAIELLKTLEGIKDGDKNTPGLDPYLCPAGVWTVGYGYVLTSGGRQLKGNKDRALAMQVYRERWPHGLTIEESADLLREECEAVGREIEKRLTLKVNDNQFCALLSFAYNVGWTTLVGPNCTLWRLLNSGRPSDEVAFQFAKWNKMKVKGEKVVSEGLVSRRKQEAALFLEPVELEVAA